ncbi:MAG TPA: hypothetical protein VMU51_13150 [Mycobacteriales bacterium]|nr:hypothetical protein [Mycobacteriales bacterium]
MTAGERPALHSGRTTRLAGIYLPPLRELLGTQPLAVADLAIVCALATLGYAAIRLDRILHPAGRTSR